MSGLKFRGAADESPSNPYASKTWVQNRDNLFVPASAVGASGGVASLDSGGRLPSTQLTTHGHTPSATLERGAIQGSTAYNVDDIGTFAGYRWICDVAHTSPSTVTYSNITDYWNKLGPDIQPLIGPWTSLSYTARNNDLVNAAAFVNILAQPYPWRPIVFGSFEMHNDAGTQATLYARFTNNAGTIVGRATTKNDGNPYWFRSEMVPHHASVTGRSPVSTPAAGIAPAGVAQSIGVYLAKDVGNGNVQVSTWQADFSVYIQYV